MADIQDQPEQDIPGSDGIDDLEMPVAQNSSKEAVAADADKDSAENVEASDAIAAQDAREAQVSSEAQASPETSVPETAKVSPAHEETSADRPVLLPTDVADAVVRAASRRHTRRSFLAASVAAGAGYGFYRYLDVGPQQAMQPIPLETAYRANAAISRGVFENHVLAPTYPLSRSENLRINGNFGLKTNLLLDSWRLQLVGTRNAAHHPRYVNDVTAWDYRYKAAPSDEDKGHDTKVDPKIAAATKGLPTPAIPEAEQDELGTGRKPRGSEEAGESLSTLPVGTPGLMLTLDDILKLPRREFVTQFKCIEGWSQFVHWAGVSMADFMELYPPEPVSGREPRYVYMETPDGDYYTGYDLSALRHPQALLVTEMMGAPLTQPHGAPLRLHMPTKYGYKQIKRIGLILYTNSKPDDYWTKLGYDWYAGL